MRTDQRADGAGYGVGGRQLVLVALAKGFSGVLPQGAGPDLVDVTAARVASHV